MSAESAPQAAPTAKPVREDERESARLCNKWVDAGLTKNRSIQFMVKHLVDLGCAPPDSFIRCMSCLEPAAGGFGIVEETIVKRSTADTKASTVTTSKEQCHRTMKDLQEQIQREQDGSVSLKIKPEIYICQQYMDNELHTHKTMAHELIHAIDACRTKMDPLHNCVHMACTEIRAENLSGECSFWKEMPRMKQYAGHGKECVRRRAILSVRANPNCTANAEKCVDAALERCFQDIYPFDRHPNLK
jgi:inner membrane protease ATP23